MNTTPIDSATTTDRHAQACATARPAQPPAKPAWSAPVVECHRTGAEVTAYAARTTG